MLTADNLLPLIVATGLKQDNIWYVAAMALIMFLPHLSKYVPWDLLSIKSQKYRHKLVVRIDDMGVAGRSSLTMHGANRYIINGIIQELINTGSVKRTTAQEIILFSDDEADTNYEAYTRGYMMILPESQVTYDGMMFEFTKTWDFTSGAEKTGATLREKVSVTVWTNNVDKTMAWMDKCKNNYVAKTYSRGMLSHQNKDKLFYYCNSKKTKEAPTDVVFEKYVNESQKTFKSIFFKRKAELVETLLNFKNRKGMWDAKSERSYKLNMILHGSPGCGKTSIIKATARLLERHIVRLSLKSIPTAEHLMDLLCNKCVYYWDMGRQIKESVPINKRLYVLEDLDCDDCSHVLHRAEDQKMSVMEKEMALKDKTKITTSELLNILDGPYELYGAMVVITTNNIEKFDPALIRPGRMDINLELTHMTDDDLREMLVYHYGKAPDPVKISKGVTPAMIEGIIQVSPMLEDFIRRSSSTGSSD